MGDRCYLEVNCMPKDAAVFEALGLTRQNDDAEPFANMVDEEANYGLSDELAKLTVPFYGYAGPGSSYGSSAFASDGKKSIEAETGYDDGFVIAFDDDGKPVKESVAEVRRYFRLLKKVKQTVGGD